MIVYNCQRLWFAEKADAETHRKLLGLRPGATLKVEVSGRGDLTILLNALCAPPPSGTPAADVAPAELIERAWVAPEHNIPDCVPIFLLDPGQRDAVLADRAARGVS